jgi:hypothetical protein
VAIDSTLASFTEDPGSILPLGDKFKIHSKELVILSKQCLDSDLMCAIYLTNSFHDMLAQLKGAKFYLILRT